MRHVLNQITLQKTDSFKVGHRHIKKTERVNKAGELNTS